jgi:hypothetical protein
MTEHRAVISWLASLEEAQAAARDKPVLIDFSAAPG